MKMRIIRCWLLLIFLRSGFATDAVQEETNHHQNHHQQLDGNNDWDQPKDVKSQQEDPKRVPVSNEPKFRTPHYFLMLSSDARNVEIRYHQENGKWRERVLLEILYFSLQFGDTTGDPQTDFQLQSHRLSNWDIQKRADDHCRWNGITCNRDGKVTGIRLEQLDFSGTLPSELQDLDSLQVLELKRMLLYLDLFCFYPMVQVLFF